MSRRPGRKAIMVQRALFALLCACGLLAAPALAADDVVRVTAATHAELARPIIRTAPAEVVSLGRTTVSARIAAPVSRVMVRAGVRVARGDLLVRLECDDYEDRLEQARRRLDELEARSRLTETQLERFRRLRQDQAISAEQLDRAVADADAARAARHAQQSTVLAASRDVQRCEVQAPITGVVTHREVNGGEFVQPGTPLIRLVDGTSVELVARLAQRDAGHIDRQTQAWFRAGGRDHSVVLRELVGDVDPAARTREARLEFDDEPPLPGTAGRLHFQLTDSAIPADLVIRREDRLGVMVVDGDHARFLPLPDAIEGRPVPAALEPDRLLIIRGRHAVRDGDPIHLDDET